MRIYGNILLQVFCFFILFLSKQDTIYLFVCFLNTFSRQRGNPNYSFNPYSVFSPVRGPLEFGVYNSTFIHFLYRDLHLSLKSLELKIKGLPKEAPGNRYVNPNSLFRLRRKRGGNVLWVVSSWKFLCYLFVCAFSSDAFFSYNLLVRFDSSETGKYRGLQKMKAKLVSRFY